MWSKMSTPSSVQYPVYPVYLGFYLSTQDFELTPVEMTGTLPYGKVFPRHSSPSLWWRTVMEFNEWLTCFSPALHLWIINPSLCLTGAETGDKSVIVVLPAGGSVNPSLCFTAPSTHWPAPPFLSSCLSQEAHIGQGDAGWVRGRHVPGELSHPSFLYLALLPLALPNTKTHV